MSPCFEAQHDIDPWSSPQPASNPVTVFLSANCAKRSALCSVTRARDTSTFPDTTAANNGVPPLPFPASSSFAELNLR